MAFPTRLVAVGAAAGVSLLATGPLTAAEASDPPSQWTNLRILDCDGTTVRAYLTPAGFGSAFHVEGSTDVIKPKHVEVMLPGGTEPVTTLDVPGFAGNDHGVVHCTYTDPVGLFVDFVGVRT
jgi:hypothetical protein